MGKEEPENPESEKIEKLPPAKEAGPELVKKVGPGEAKEAQVWANKEVHNLVEKSLQTFEELTSIATKEGVDPEKISSLEEKFKSIYQEMQNLLKQYEADLAKYTAPTKELEEVEALLGVELGEATKAGETEKEALKSKVEEAKKGVEVVGKKLEELAKAREETELKEREAKRIDTMVDALDKSGVKMASVIENLDPAVAGEAISQAIDSIKTGKDLSQKEKNRVLEVQKNQDSKIEELNKNKETQIKNIESRFQIPADLQGEKEKLASARSKLEGMTEAQKTALGKDKYDLALSVLATKEGDLQKRIDQTKQDFINQEKGKIDEEFKKKEEGLEQGFGAVLRKLALETKGGDALKQLMKEGKINDDKLAEVLAKQIEDKPDNFEEEAYRFFPKDILGKVLEKIPDEKILKFDHLPKSLKMRNEFLNRWQGSLDKKAEEYKGKRKEIKEKEDEFERLGQKEAAREQYRLGSTVEEDMESIIVGATGGRGERKMSDWEKEIGYALGKLVRGDKSGWDETRKKILREVKNGVEKKIGGGSREGKAIFGTELLNALITDMERVEELIEKITAKNETLFSQGKQKFEEISKEVEQILANPDFQKEKLDSYNLENPEDYKKINQANRSLIELSRKISDVRSFLANKVSQDLRWSQSNELKEYEDKISKIEGNYETRPFVERWQGEMRAKTDEKGLREKLGMLEELEDSLGSDIRKFGELKNLFSEKLENFDRDKSRKARQEKEEKEKKEWEKERDKKAETLVGDVTEYKQYRQIEVLKIKMDEGIFDLNENLIRFLGEKRQLLENTIKELEHFNEIKDQYSLFKREIEGKKKKECENEISELKKSQSSLEAEIKKSEDEIRESLSRLQDRGEKAKKQLVAGEFKKWLGARAEEGIYKDAPKIISKQENEQHFSGLLTDIKKKIETDIEAKIKEAEKAVESILSSDEKK